MFVELSRSKPGHYQMSGKNELLRMCIEIGVSEDYFFVKDMWKFVVIPI